LLIGFGGRFEAPEVQVFLPGKSVVFPGKSVVFPGESAIFPEPGVDGLDGKNRELGVSA
jgi:hypothetical protein